LPVLDPEPFRVALLERLQQKMPSVKRWWEEDPGVDAIVREFTSSPVQGILTQSTIEGNGGTGLATVWEIIYSLGIVASKVRENKTPDTALNAAFVELQGALLRLDSEASELQDGDEVYTTLDGIAVRCRIVGKVEFEPGVVTGVSGFTASISVLSYADHGS
jgi:hypothetical protein